jgi:uncharacterized protein (DUF2062 family)
MGNSIVGVIMMHQAVKSSREDVRETQEVPQRHSQEVADPVVLGMEIGLFLVAALFLVGYYIWEHRVKTKMMEELATLHLPESGKSKRGSRRAGDR